MPDANLKAMNSSQIWENLSVDANGYLEVDVKAGTVTVTGAVTTSGTVTEASAADILAALNKLVPVTSGQYATTTSTVADAEIVLATQNISSTNGITISISEDTYILFAQATGGSTSTSMIFLAGTHYIPFTFTHLVHKAVSSNGTITLIGKSTA